MNTPYRYRCPMLLPDPSATSKTQTPMTQSNSHRIAARKTLAILVVILCGVLAGCTTGDTGDSGADCADKHCLCTLAQATVTLTNAEGTPLPNVTVDTENIELSCYDEADRTVCSFSADDGELELTLSADGYQPKTQSFTIESGTSDGCCGCGWSWSGNVGSGSTC